MDMGQGHGTGGHLAPVGPCNRAIMDTGQLTGCQWSPFCRVHSNCAPRAHGQPHWVVRWLRLACTTLSVCNWPPARRPRLTPQSPCCWPPARSLPLPLPGATTAAAACSAVKLDSSGYVRDNSGKGNVFPTAQKAYYRSSTAEAVATQGLGGDQGRSAAEDGYPAILSCALRSAAVAVACPLASLPEGAGMQL